VDVSPTGDLIVVVIDNELIFYNKELQVTKEISTPVKIVTETYPSEYFIVEVESVDREDISAIQINDINDMYFGTYSGRVFKFTKDGVTIP
jgi:hypothetical protein